MHRPPAESQVRPDDPPGKRRDGKRCDDLHAREQERQGQADDGEKVRGRARVVRALEDGRGARRLEGRERVDVEDEREPAPEGRGGPQVEQDLQTED